MNDYLSFLLVGGAFLVAVVVLLTAEPKTSKRLTAIAGGAALIGGLLFYGCSYLSTSGAILETVLHTVFAVCRMFLGESDFLEVAEDVPLFEQQWAVTLCWCVHVLAFYATSSTAISLIGANVLKNLRVFLSGRKDLSIIYGVNEESVSFGQALIEQTGELVVFVTEDAETQLAEAVVESGGVLRADSKAVSGNKQFLKSLGIRKGSRKITLYALSKEHLKNLEYATAMLEAFEQRRVKPAQISLVIHERETQAVKKLQVSGEAFGYGFITVFQEPGLTARLLIQKYPPCHCVSFDAEGNATEDFEAIVIGFGAMGQTVLRHIIMNAQFVGNTFRADVFAPDLSERSGFFKACYPGVIENYKPNFHSHDGRSEELYTHLSAHLDKVKYVAVCTGDDALNDEVAAELCAFFEQKGKVISVHQCSNKGIKTTGVDIDTMHTTVHSIYHPDVLSTKKLDAMAMAINQHYMGEYSKGAVADWMDCNYFSRMSSRAFADYVEAILCAAGRTEQQAFSGDWMFSEQHLENLSKMEHYRWNAFHFCMGFMPMSDEEFDARTRIYEQEVAQCGKAKIRIAKNMTGKTHACLVSWDGLDVLSAKENSVTGGNVNYKQLDTDNILLVPHLLQIKGRNSKELES